MPTIIWMLCLVPFQAEPPRSTEIAYMEARSRAAVTNPMTPDPALLKLQQQRFARQFNVLVQAVEEFSVAYNENKGLTWPAQKAAALRKAMADLQKIDPNFNPNVASTSAAR